MEKRSFKIKIKSARGAPKELIGKSPKFEKKIKNLKNVKTSLSFS
jgi:hypothetical protein